MINQLYFKNATLYGTPLLTEQALKPLLLKGLVLECETRRDCFKIYHCKKSHRFIYDKNGYKETLCGAWSAFTKNENLITVITPLKADIKGLK